MTIKKINLQCHHSDIELKNIYVEISRVYDRRKIYNSPTGYFGNYQRKGNASWTERLPKTIDNNDSYLLLCFNKSELSYHAMKYTTFSPSDFKGEKPVHLNFEIDIYEVSLEVSWEQESSEIAQKKETAKEKETEKYDKKE